MLHTVYGLKGMATAPHHAASQAGLDILKDGGTAVEAGGEVGLLAGLPYRMEARMVEQLVLDVTG